MALGFYVIDKDRSKSRTRMHSSRMRTACFLTISQDALAEGCLPGGVCSGGVSAQGGCLPRQGCLPGGVCSGGVSAQGGVCPGGVCPGGCLPRGVCLDTPVNRILDTHF